MGLFYRSRHEEQAILERHLVILEHSSQQLQESINLLNEKLVGLSQNSAAAFKYTSARFSESETRDSEVSHLVHKNNMSIEDMIDEMNKVKKNDDAVTQLCNEQTERIEHFLELAETYQEQFFSISRILAGKNSSWNSQLERMQEEINTQMILCGMTPLGERGKAVNLEFCEIIGTVKTTDATLDKIIADVLSTGYVYCGKVRKKARVTVYKHDASMTAPPKPADRTGLTVHDGGLARVPRMPQRSAILRHNAPGERIGILERQVGGEYVEYNNRDRSGNIYN